MSNLEVKRSIVVVQKLNMVATSDKDEYYYEVVSAKNTVEYPIGKALSQESVRRAIQNGVQVDVKGK